MTKAVVLVSGGLDSSVTLAIARDEVGAAGCYALSFDYGQRHRHELTAAGRVAAQLGMPKERHIVLPIGLSAFGGSALTDSHLDVPKDRDERAMAGAGAIPVTYVPARNLVFLSCAAAYAETVGAERIYLGVNAVDYSGYPDCRPEFIEAFERAANLGTRAGVESLARDGRAAMEVRAPLIGMSKAEIIVRGTELGVHFSITHSCYDPVVRGTEVLACGHCDSCLIRKRGFEQAHVPDVTRYA